MLTSAGDCRSEIDGYCQGTEPGEGRLADCLTQQLVAEAQPTASTSESQRPFGDACRHALDIYRRDRAENINLNLPLGKGMTLTDVQLVIRGMQLHWDIGSNRLTLV